MAFSSKWPVELRIVARSEMKTKTRISLRRSSRRVRAGGLAATCWTRSPICCAAAGIASFFMHHSLILHWKRFKLLSQLRCTSSVTRSVLDDDRSRPVFPGSARSKDSVMSVTARDHAMYYMPVNDPPHSGRPGEPGPSGPARAHCYRCASGIVGFKLTVIMPALVIMLATWLRCRPSPGCAGGPSRRYDSDDSDRGNCSRPQAQSLSLSWRFRLVTYCGYQPELGTLSTSLTRPEHGHWQVLRLVPGAGHGSRSPLTVIWNLNS